MHIFLDTTVTFSDPFLKKGYTHIILKLAKEHKELKFFMSDVVFKETERHFNKNVSEHLNNIRKEENELGSYKLLFSASEKNSINSRVAEESNELLKEFQVFYKDLIDEGVLQILTSNNELLPELIHRAVNRIKPFQEGKSEFRDAVTWLTYRDFIKQNELSSCYFISNNVNDFFEVDKAHKKNKNNQNNQPPEKLHPELIKDGTGLKPFVSFTHLRDRDDKIKQYIEEKQRRVVELQDWIEQNNIDEKYAIRILNENYEDIYNLCKDYITHFFSPIMVLPVGRSLLDSLFNVQIDITSNLRNYKNEIIADEIIISAEATIKTVHYLFDVNTQETITRPIETIVNLPFLITLETELGEIISMQFSDLYHYHLSNI
ncbi:PIN domain-containing protein [Niallia taxi]|uniref:PIN domain-containing protein n=1 Tax=Niallia taxi TaxID=2499688 RepID=UPI003982C189